MTQFHIVWTLALLVVFIGIVLWAWSGRPRKEFEEAANLLENTLAFQKAVGSRPREKADILHQLGKVYYRTGDYEKALSSFQKAVELRENRLFETEKSFRENLFYLGMIQMKTGRLDSSDATLRRAFRVSQSEPKNSRQIWSTILDLSEKRGVSPPSKEAVLSEKRGTLRTQSAPNQ